MEQLSASQKDNQISAATAQKILHAVASIAYGSVEVVIHENKVVQIECREKIRVDQSGSGRKTPKP